MQNAADSAALAGTRVLGLDLKWRAVNTDNPSPPPAPFANVDQEVCDAINEALDYNTNSAQSIDPIDCYAGSDDAQYVDFDRNALGRVGEGVPPLAQGVRVSGTGQSGTFLMGVIGIDSIDVSADATALAGPGEPPLGNLMPFVAQNPLGPFVPGDQYQIRSEDEGECGTASVDQHLADIAGESGIVLASYVRAGQGGGTARSRPPRHRFRSRIRPARPSRPRSRSTLSAENGAKIHYTTDGIDADRCERPVLRAAHVHLDHDPEGDRQEGQPGQRDRHVQLHAGHAARAWSPRRLVTARSSPASSR